MAYKEIKLIIKSVKRRIKNDPNRPYNIRKKNGDAEVTRFGKQEFEFRTINDMLTQSLKEADFSRLSEGDKRRTWRFATVIPPEFLKLNDQVQYKGDWFEVKRVNPGPGDEIIYAHIVQVT